MNIKNKELTELYKYVESYCLLDPVNGNIPFKLYPYQKKILKAIHENDKLLIVKARQIGMTNLLAAYAAWLSNKTPTCISVYPSFTNYQRDFKTRLDKFGAINGYENPNKYTKYHVLRYFDESLFKQELSWGRGFKDFPNQKTIVCNSIDSNGHVKEFIEKHTDWKILYYPYNKCKDAFKYRDIKSIKKTIGETSWKREFECKFV